MQERDLINTFKSGQADAFKELYHRYFNDVFSLCYRYCRSQEISEELTHDAFVLLWQKSSLLDADQSIKAYLLRIARHEVFRWMKKNALANTVKEEVKLNLQDKQANYSPDSALDASIDLERVKSFLNSFPTKRKLVFEMVRFDELSYAEVAEKLAISRDAVKDHMIKANRMIRKFQQDNEIAIGTVLVAMCLLPA